MFLAGEWETGIGILSSAVWWPVLVAFVLSVVAAFYYLRVIKVMYFDEPADSVVVDAGGTLRVLLSINGLAVLVLGIFPGALIDLCARVLP